MRIGFDVAQTCVDKAGCGWYADSLARALAKEAPEHQFDLYHHFGTWINASTEKGTQIVATNVRAPLAGFAPDSAQRLWSTGSGLQSLGPLPDIVHANCYQAPSLKGPKLVYTVYDVSFWAHPEFTTEANRLVCQSGTLAALSRADGFVFISQSAKDEFERFLPGWLDRTGKPYKVTLLGPRGDSPLGSSTHSTANYWFAVGSLEPRKNYEAILDGLENYWKRSANPLPLKIAGGGGWRSEALKQRIKSLSEKGQVQYLGYVPDEQLPELYIGARALVFPSWYEGFGLPVLEAMTFGCPVITSKKTSLPEVGGTAALYVDPATPRQIADAMLCLEDHDYRRKKVRESKRQASTFTWERTARQTLDLYCTLLK